MARKPSEGKIPKCWLLPILRACDIANKLSYPNCTCYVPLMWTQLPQINIYPLYIESRLMCFNSKVFYFSLVYQNNILSLNLPHKKSSLNSNEDQNESLGCLFSLWSLQYSRTILISYTHWVISIILNNTPKKFCFSGSVFSVYFQTI